MTKPGFARITVVLGLSASALVFPPTGARAATTVPCSGEGGGEAGLVVAVEAANADPDASTIVLEAGCTYELTEVNDEGEFPEGVSVGPSGLPRIVTDITIQGRGATIQRGADAPPIRILNVDGAATLTLVQTTLSGGLAGCGGAIWTFGKVNLRLSTLAGNTAVALGGAICAQALQSEPQVNIARSAFIQNRALARDELKPGHAGGIFMSTGANLEIANSTLSGNIAEGEGSQGGAIGNLGTATLTHVTFAGNEAAEGGSIWSDGTVTLENTIVSGPAPGENETECLGTMIDGGNNLTFGGSGCPGLHADPMLGDLADNGGPSPTHALLAGSPAIDEVPTDAGCPQLDQRGVFRPVGSACDIGTFEHGRNATSLTLNSGKAPDVLFAYGTLTRPTKGQTVVVRILKKIGGVFRVLDEHEEATDRRGHYETAFVRPRPGRCKLTAKYAGDLLNHPSSAPSKTFDC